MDEAEPTPRDTVARPWGRRLRIALLAVLSGAAISLWVARLYLPFAFPHTVPPPLPVVASGPLAGLRLAPAYPALRFQRPVFATWAPDRADRVYVLEQAGVIRRFDDRADVGASEVFLDIRERVSRAGNEEGLLGLAFPPDYVAQRALYVYYSEAEAGPPLGGRSIVARFRLGDDGLADPASEERLLEVEQPFRNHNGGMLAFGPDGMLYVALGDGGWAGDPHGNGQDPSTLLGAILRLDPSQAEPPLAYAIPADNPFRSAGGRPEVWAFGLRNPWRFSFDRATGELWAADVGQNAWEEVDLVVRGANYGWRAYEGFAVYDAALAKEVTNAVPPLAAYGHGEGASVTGGYVYRGRALPELVGHYVFGDFQSGAVWALARDPQAPAEPDGEAPTAAGVKVTKLLLSGRLISSFGEAPDGELVVCTFEGELLRLAK